MATIVPCHRVERFQFLLRGDADASTTSDQSAPGALPASTARNSDSQFEKLWRSQELRKLAQEGMLVAILPRHRDPERLIRSFLF